MTIKRAIYPVLAALLLPGLAYAQTQTVATFNVTKDFTDGNPKDVTVRIECNNGLILDSDAEISEAGGVGFVATNFTPDGSATCTITEDAEPGYTTTYEATEGNNDVRSVDTTEDSDSTPPANGCVFKGLLNPGNSFFNCKITNTPKSVNVEIDKVWMLEGGLDNYNGVDTGYQITLTCTNGDFTPSTYCNKAKTCQSRTWYEEGPAPWGTTVAVTPLVFGGSSCMVTEEAYDSVVESSVNCTGNIVATGSGLNCTVTNSVFFEGIPTLSQYGMAIMALLMLGVGFVGFRRFV